MATKFSPCKGSYVLNQFPSNVMFGMNGFHVSASGAIQGHHGPLVLCVIVCRASMNLNLQVYPFLSYCCPIFLTVMRESGQWLGKKNLVPVTYKKSSGKGRIGALATAIYLK